MPVLTIDLDHAGKPTVAIYVSVGEEIAESYAEFGRTIPPSRLVEALVDTGTSQAIVALSVLTSLGLVAIGRTTFNTVSSGDSPLSADVYQVDLAFAGDKPGPLIAALEVIGSDRLRGVGVQMLLGRDVLDQCLIVYNGPDRRVSLAYDQPNQPRTASQTL